MVLSQNAQLKGKSAGLDEDLVPSSSRSLRGNALEQTRQEKISLPRPRETASPGFRHEVSEFGIGSYYWKEDTKQKDLNRSTLDCGIRHEVTLPRFKIDPKRYHHATAGETWNKTGPMDRASLYVGLQVMELDGKSLGKSDCGVAWQRVVDARGNPTFTDRSEGSDMRDPKHRFTIIKPSAPRTIPINGTNIPIVREIRDGTGALRYCFARGKDGTEQIVDAQYRKIASGQNCFARFQRTILQANFAYIPFARVGDKWQRFGSTTQKGNVDNAFYPGEKVVMRLAATGLNQLRFDVRQPGSKNHTFSRFEQEGVGQGLAQIWKNVIAIDQFTHDSLGRRQSNEMKHVISTAARLDNALLDKTTIFHGGSVYRNGKISQIPHTSGTVTVGKDIDPIKNRIFGFVSFNSGARSISVHPAL